MQVDLTWISGADACVQRLAQNGRRTVPVERTMKFASKLLAHYFLEKAHLLSAKSPWSPLLIGKKISEIGHYLNT